MFVNSSYKKLKTLDGLTYDLPSNVYHHLNEANKRKNNNFDNVIIITGGVGSGKSNGAKGICGSYHETFLNKPYCIDNVYFLIENVLKSLNDTTNFGDAINYDEAVQGATGKDGISKIGYTLRKAFITKRKKKHLITLCIDNPKELNDKVIERCIAWYHCFYIRTKTGRYIKGLFKVFSAKELHKVYEDLKNNRYRFAEQHPIYKRNNMTHRFKNYSKLFYDEKDYDLKKDAETNLMDEQEQDKRLLQRDALIKYVLKKKLLKQADIVGICGLAETTVRNIKNKKPPTLLAI